MTETTGPDLPPASSLSLDTAVERGHGPPVVFLHGYPLNHAMWDPQLEPLSRSNRIILLDLPGYGLAMDREVPDRFWPYVEDVARTLGAYLTEPCVVVGHSFGGYLALGLYRNHPGIFSALVLSDTRSDPDTPQARDGRLATANRLERPGERLDADEMVRGLLAPATWASRGAVVESVHAMVAQAPTPSIVRTLRAIADRPDLGPILPTIDVPSLVLWGTEDHLIPPSQSEAMARQIARSSTLPIPAAGHLPSLESPAVFSAGLRRFLDEVASPKPS